MIFPGTSTTYQLGLSILRRSCYNIGEQWPVALLVDHFFFFKMEETNYSEAKSTVDKSWTRFESFVIVVVFSH